MPTYHYQALNSRGKKVKGSKDAENERVLRQLLMREGLVLTQLGDQVGAGQGLLQKEINFGEMFESVKPEDVAIFTRQFATLVKARFPLSDALAACVEQIEKPKLKKIVAQLKTDVNEGVNLAASLEQYEDVFGPLYSNMVRSGEASGTLDEVLMRLAEFTEAQVELTRKIKSAMMYPMIMVCIGGLILGALFIFVIPKITEVFQDSGQELPLVTAIIISISDFLIGYWHLMIAMIGGSIYGFKRYVKTEKGRFKWDVVRLKVPVFGQLSLLVAVTRFTKTLGTLLRSGVPLLTALDITKNVLENQQLIGSISEAQNLVKEGSSLAAPLKSSGHFPTMVVHMIAVGERTGALEEMLGVIANTYESQVEDRVSRLTTLLEPVMIVGLGGVIAVIVFAILLPILHMNEFMQGG